MQALAGVHVEGVCLHIKFVVLLQVWQLDSQAIAVRGRVECFTVQSDGVNLRGNRVDEGLGAGLGAVENNSGVRSESAFGRGQVESYLVRLDAQNLGAFGSFDSG
ncbi:unannotated protein [freshwater metagenome]|uniref:Unannotated protein n=1 Tax=freshwater metagenome TaxID=449393 RepID=A0A6J7KQS2_9ZZZZ